jgi:hypothetical protein
MLMTNGKQGAAPCKILGQTYKVLPGDETHGKVDTACKVPRMRFPSQRAVASRAKGVALRRASGFHPCPLI